MPYKTSEESAAWLPSPSGQRTEMPSNKGPAHPLGPYAPRSAGGPSHTAADSDWLPTPSGQFKHGLADAGSMGGNNLNYQDPTKSAKPMHGNGEDGSWLPTPSGQYSHGMEHNSKGDSHS